MRGVIISNPDILIDEIGFGDLMVRKPAALILVTEKNVDISRQFVRWVQV